MRFFRFSALMILVGTLLPLQAGAQSGTVSAASLGQLSVDADSTSYHGNILAYYHAHLTGKNGLSINTDEVDLSLKTQDAQMHGHIKAHFSKAAQSQDITVTADKADYVRSQNQVVLSGNVKMLVYSSYTDGPLVQTGDSAVIQFGPAPEYPLITMNHVHATFTPGH